MTDPLLSAVIVAYNSADDLRELLPRLVHPQIEVLVLDNDSPDDGAATAAALAHVRLIEVGDNAGWSIAGNLGAAAARAPVLAFVNPDSRPTVEDLLALAARLQPGVAAVAPRFVGTDGRAQAFYFRFPGAWDGLFTFLNAGQRIDRWLGGPFIRRRTYDFGNDVPVHIDQPGAACLVVDAGTFRSVGGFDPQMWLFFSDTDWCLRARRNGLHIIVANDVEVVHEGGGSVGHMESSILEEVFQRDYVAYARKHYGSAGRILTITGVWLLSGLLPAVASLVRAHPRVGAARLGTARRVVATRR